MAKTDYDVVIIGGGVSGLMAAWDLRDRRVLLLEGTDRLGGRLKSLDRPPLWLNLGGHLLPPPGSPFYRLVEGLGLATLRIPGSRSAIFWDGRLHVPKNMAVLPFTLGLSLRERVALAMIGMRVLAAVRTWKKAVAPIPGEAPADRRLRVAAYLADRSFETLLGPLTPKLRSLFQSAVRRAAADMDEQSAGVGLALFGTVWADTPAYNLAGGSGRLGASAAEVLGGIVRFGADANRVEKTAHGVKVTYTTSGAGHEVTASQVIVATPAPIAARIVKGLPDDVQECLSSVRYGPFVALGMMTDEIARMPYDDIYAVLTPHAPFDMLFNHANPVLAEQRRGGGSLMAYAGGKAAQALVELDDEAIADRFLEELLTMFPQLKGHISETVVQRWEVGNTFRYPGFSFEPVHAYCRRDDTDIHLAGDYFGQIGNMDTASAAGSEAAARVRSRLDASSRAS